MAIVLVLMFCLMSIEAYANPACAVCTVAIGASLEVARRMGVDDAVIGVWAGAFLLILGYWTNKWLDKKGWNFKGRELLVLVLSVLMILFMYISHLVYTPKAILIFWLDPFLFAAICGALVFHYTMSFYQWMKMKNGGHAHFPFEKVVLPFAAVALTAWYFGKIELCAPALPDLTGL